jgi:hypothetical protein
MPEALRELDSRRGVSTGGDKDAACCSLGRHQAEQLADWADRHSPHGVMLALDEDAFAPSAKH